jgi:predicted PurR-regulated permease PerM
VVRLLLASHSELVDSLKSRKSRGSAGLPLAYGGTSKPPPLIFLATLILTFALLYWAQAVLIPVALSLLLTFLLAPVVEWLERMRLGRVPAVILAVIFAFSVLAAMGWLITSQLTKLAGDLPKYEANIKRKIADVRQIGKGGTIERVQESVEEIKEEINKSEPTKKGESSPREVLVKGQDSATFWPVPAVAGTLVERLAGAGLAIVLVIFMLFERADLRNRLIRLIGYARLTVTTRALEEAGSRISRYLLAQSAINAFYGIAVGVGLSLIGLPYAVLWGVLGALLRFIPYVGPWMAAIMPTALALAAFEGWLWPIVVIGLIAVLELFTNTVLETLLYSDSAGVSQVALLIAIAFWTWLWGPIGLLMATPLTVCLVVLGKYVPQMQFIAVLMSDEPVAESDIIYYQRLLAGDQEEAAQIVREYLKSHPHERVYDDVLLPALNYAKLDRDRGGLSEEEHEAIVAMSRNVVEMFDSSAEKAHRGDPATEKLSAREKIHILACPADDDSDEVASMMLRQALGSEKYAIEIVPEEKLASEVIDAAAEKNPGLVCIAAVAPGGLSQARYLCKRLRARFPDLKIIVGRWGHTGESEGAQRSLVAGGADRVATSLLQARDEIISLGRLTIAN